MKQTASPEITRITLQVLSIGLLICGAFWILEFFLPSILWATIIAVTTWPMFQSVQRRLWDRRALAIAVMVGALLVIVVLPCAFAIDAIISNTDKISGWADSMRQLDLPSPPASLQKIPVLGQGMIDVWQKADALLAEGSTGLAPYARTIIAWFVAKAGSVGVLLVQFLLMVIIAVVLYARGESASAMVHAFCRRLAGTRGDEIATLAAKAVRSVALGVVVTALAQAILSGIGLAVAGIHSAILLTAIIFVLCLCQIGPGLIVVPAIVWLYWRGQAGSGTVLLIFAIFILPMDNFLRPILIRKGADIPLMLVFMGVIGGLLTMGVIGLFIGPVILAVANTLLVSWIKDESAASLPATGGNGNKATLLSPPV